jgi:hypothetical protein
MSTLEIILALVVLVAIAIGGYTLLMDGDRREQRIESERAEALGRSVAPRATDFDPTHFKPPPTEPEADPRRAAPSGGRSAGARNGHRLGNHEHTDHSDRERMAPG